MRSSYSPAPPPAAAVEAASAAAAAAAAAASFSYHHNAYYPSPAAEPSHHQSYHTERDQQRISTLFVAGLPDDVKPREIYNLFSRRPGFDSTLLEFTGRGNQAVAFVTFFTHHAAVAAMNTLNGAIFDPETGHTLHIELAKSNSRRPPRAYYGPYRVIDKRGRAKIQGDDQHEYKGNEGDDGDDGDDEPVEAAKKSENESENKNENETEIENDNGNSGNEHVTPAEESGDENGSMRKRELPTTDEKTEITQDVPPCSTLFIANLAPNCTRDELNVLLLKYPGLQSLKLLRRGGASVAFADFEDIESATVAMDGLKGTSLPSSDRGPVHLEYARSKMRKKL